MDWELKGGYIRAGSCCPITSFTKDSAIRYTRCGTALGLSYKAQAIIADTADFRVNGKYSPWLRKRLLQICKLKEPSNFTEGLK